MKQTICPNCGGSLESVAIGWKCKKCKGFISLQDGKFFEYVEQPFMPPQTNADRIRAMSDEELANWLARTQMGAIKDAMDILQFPYDATDEIVELGARESLLWLKQPADMKGE